MKLIRHRRGKRAFRLWGTLSACLLVAIGAFLFSLNGCSGGNPGMYSAREPVRTHRTAAAIPNDLTANADILPGEGFRSRESTYVPGPPATRPGGSAGSGAGRPSAEPSVSRIADLAPPQSLPSRDEELWVIEKRPADVASPRADDGKLPASGALLAKTAPETPIEQMQPCPLKHTAVHASIAGYIAGVDVTQQFQNPFSEKIEAVYVFPLPANAAVNDFVMTVGDRKIRGIVREREQAKQIYAAARSQGYVASLLTQERPNIFTQSVANIEPGKRIDITIRYFHTLTYSNGSYELNFPMVVGPRFNPPGSTDGIGAVGPGARGATGQKTEVSYLRPGTRSGHDIAVTVHLDAGVPFEDVTSVNHQIQVQWQDKRHAVVTLNPADTLPNKDFVLRWRVAGKDVKSGVVSTPDGKGGGYFAMMIVPPIVMTDLPRKPMEFVFTLDVSGSMSGRPIQQAKQAMLLAMRRLTPTDSFQVVKFASDAQQMSPAPLPATPENIAAALRYIEQADAGGGTMMLDGMRKSLDFPVDPDRMRIVAFLTDGYIGNEREILSAMHGWIGRTRVFSFGVGSSVNRYLLDQMAKVGQGAAAYVGLNENPEEAMATFFDRASHPAMTDLSADFGPGKAAEVFPQKLPDLFVGRTIIITGKYTGEAPATVKITGRLAGQTRMMEVPIRSAEPTVARALPSVWARAKIAELADSAAYQRDIDLPRMVKQVALEYGLMSSFTAFVAVDGTRKTEGDHGITTPVAVPVPDGVRYDTTVTEGNRAIQASERKEP